MGKFKAKVVDNPDGLPMVSTPVSTSARVGVIPNNSEVIIDNVKASIDGTVWAHIEGGSWVMYQSRGITTLRITGTVNEPVKQDPEPDIPNNPTILKPASPKPDVEIPASSPKPPSTPSNDVEDIAESVQNVANSATESILYGDYKYDTSGGTGGHRIPPNWHGTDFIQNNTMNYPKFKGVNSNGENMYDWSTNLSATDGMANIIKQIKRDLNVPSGYTREELNILMNNSFNRYKITYPDYMATGLSGVAFFTRPDLYLLGDNGEYLEQVKYEPQLYFLSRSNSLVMKQLTMGYSTTHEFLPLLCNTVKSLDVSDESVELMETGETFLGNKMQYAKHNVKSMIAGSFSCRFTDSYDLSVTNLFQAWCTYESNVFLGTMEPKLEYISRGIIDYACDAYVFFRDRNNIIRFFTKYYGVFPTSVGKSAYSYNDGDAVHFPEQNIQFAYFAKADLDPSTIVEFNAHSKLPLTYKTDHDDALGHGGNTWSGPPFVEMVHVEDGTIGGADRLYLRYRPNTKTTDENVITDDDIERNRITMFNPLKSLQTLGYTILGQ